MMLVRPAAALALLLASAALAAPPVAPSEVKPSSPNAAAPGARAEALPADAPPTTMPSEKVAGLDDAEQKFVDRMLAALNARDAEACCKLVSMKSVAARATDSLSAYPQEIERVNKTISGKTVPILFTYLFDHGYDPIFSVLSTSRSPKGESEITFRGRGEDLEYISFVIAPVGGEVRAIDVKAPNVGDWYSQHERTWYLLQIQNFHGGAVESGDIIDLIKRYDADDFKGVLEAYDKLTDKPKKNKWVQRTRVSASVRLGMPEAIVAAEDAAKIFPGDPQWLMTLEHAYRHQQKWAELESTLDRLDAIYHDPQIAGIKAVISANSGDPKLALELARKTLATDPKNREMLDLLVDATLKSEAWDALPAVLDQWEKGTGESMYDEVRKTESYKAFRKTPQGKAWLAEKKKAQAKK